MKLNSKSKRKSVRKSLSEIRPVINPDINVRIHSGLCSNCRSGEKFRKGVRVIEAEMVMCYRLPTTAKLYVNNKNVLYEDEYSGEQKFSIGKHIDLC